MWRLFDAVCGLRRKTPIADGAKLERELAAAQRAERALAAARAIIQEQADPEGEIYCWFEPVHIEEGLLQQELARLTKAIRG